jgi:hypothetical protein
MRDFVIDRSITVRRPPEAVFALLADIQDVEPIPQRARVEMVKEPTGPTRVGTPAPVTGRGLRHCSSQRSSDAAPPLLPPLRQ